jgi:hypothetical protein
MCIEKKRVSTYVVSKFSILNVPNSIKIRDASTTQVLPW